MIFIPEAPLHRATSIVLALYVGAIVGPALCVLHASDMDSQMGAGLDGFAGHASSSTAAGGAPPTGVHASSSMATHGSPPAVVHAPPSMAVHDTSQHGAHTDASGEDHSGVCAVGACGSAVAAQPDHGLESMTRFSNPRVAYSDGTMPPEAETVLPPPRLG